jgi:hypothetical protein
LPQKTAKIDANLPKDAGIEQQAFTVSKAEEPLVQEAKKYKSSDEFVKAQGEEIYHATNAVFNEYNPAQSNDFGTWFAKDKKGLATKDFPILKEEVLKPNTKLITEKQFDKLSNTKKAIDDNRPFPQFYLDKGYKGIDYGDGNIQLWTPNEDIISKSQLTEIWNKANKNFSKVENPLLNIPKIKSPERINYLERYNINKAELLKDKDVVINKFFNEIKKNEPKFISITEDIASKFGGEYTYRMKSPESVLIKMGRRGDKFTLGNVDDALGSTVITNDIDGALLKAKKDYKITNVDVDDFRKKPTFLGYKAVHLDVELPNGQIAEIQLNTKNGLIRKEEGHKTYEKWREYIETAQGSNFEDILKKIPQKNKAEFIKDVEYSIGIFDGTIPVAEEVIKSVENRIIKTKNPLSSVMNNG